MDLLNTVSGLDPTGVLSTTAAAIGLVGSVLRVVPLVKNASANIKRNHPSDGGGGGGGESGGLSLPTLPTLNRSQTATGVPESQHHEPRLTHVDPERVKRAYETVNYVLREFGSRICQAGLVNGTALTTALSGATKHIEVRLFSSEANRLFESLAAKLNDPILVNSVFTSIYLIGALNAELSSSLPNYKDTYVPIGPRLVQQLFRTAIGEQAFRDNLSANLDAYNTLAITAGLLRPTDIGYSSFPGFPSFSPSRYSSRSFGDVRNNKLAFEKAIRHFEKTGFPQPMPSRKKEVGAIKDWRFLAGDLNSRAFDVEKADKHIGDNFGRVLYWLVCSADRMPPGVAVIAYHDQHIDLINWIGDRLGYSVFGASTDLEMTGAHVKLDKKAKAIVGSWVIIMASEKAQTKRRAAATEWTETINASQPVVAPAPPPPPSPTPKRAQLVPMVFTDTKRSVASGAPVAATYIPSQNSPPLTATEIGGSNCPAELGVPDMTFYPPEPKSVVEQLEQLNMDLDAWLPQCRRFITHTPLEEKNKQFEYRRLTETIEQNIILKLDAIQIGENDETHRQQRKVMIGKAQEVLQELESRMGVSPSGTPLSPNTEAGSTGINPISVSPDSPEEPHVPTQSNIGQDIISPVIGPMPTPVADGYPSKLAEVNAHILQTSPTNVSPPPYSPSATPSAAGTSAAPTGFPYPDGRRPGSVIKRKAPPPPKKYVAIYDFEPESENEEELAFKEGNEIEIVEKTPALEAEGWCKARIKGTKKVGMVPLEYLEEVKRGPDRRASTASTIESPVTSPGASNPAMAPISEAHNIPQLAQPANFPGTSPSPGLQSTTAPAAVATPALQPSPLSSLQSPAPRKSNAPIINIYQGQPGQPGYNPNYQSGGTANMAFQAAGLALPLLGGVASSFISSPGSESDPAYNPQTSGSNYGLDGGSEAAIQPSQPTITTDQQVQQQSVTDQTYNSDPTQITNNYIITPDSDPLTLTQGPGALTQGLGPTTVTKITNPLGVLAPTYTSVTPPPDPSEQSAGGFSNPLAGLAQPSPTLQFAGGPGDVNPMNPLSDLATDPIQASTSDDGNDDGSGVEGVDLSGMDGGFYGGGDDFGF